AGTEPVAITLQDGRVLVVGTTTCELFDPISETWRHTGSPPFVLPGGHRLALLGDGRVLLTYNQQGETYDPTSGSWQPIAPPPFPFNGGHVSVSLPDGSVLIAGGGMRRALLFDASLMQFLPLPDTHVFHLTPIGILLGDGTVLVAGDALP